MYFQYKNQDIYYDIIGEGSKLVILHGWGVSSISFKEVVKKLSTKYQVITIDLLGFGMSDEPLEPLNLDDYVDSVHSLLSNLSIEYPIILGHSFGGRIAIKYAMLYPVSSLILVSSAGIKHRSIKTKWKIYKYKLKKYFYKIFKKQKLQELLSSSGSEDYKNATPIMKKTMSNVIDLDLRNEISKLNNKVLLLWGFKDNITPLVDGVYMNNQIKNSRLIIFYDSGHFPYLDEPDKFVKIVMNGGL